METKLPGSIDCFDCGNGIKAILSNEQRTLNVKGEPKTATFYFYKCEKCGNQFTTDESDNKSLLNFDDNFQKKYEDLFINLFTEKYSFKEKLTVLAELEKNQSLFLDVIKLYHPKYCILNFFNKEEVAIFNLIEDVKNNKSNFKQVNQ